MRKRACELATKYTYREAASLEYGESFEGEGEAKEIVVTEMDVTMIHSQEGKGKNTTVKLGIMYSGKELESETGDLHLEGLATTLYLARREALLIPEQAGYSGILDCPGSGDDGWSYHSHEAAQSTKLNVGLARLKGQALKARPFSR